MGGIPPSVALEMGEAVRVTREETSPLWRLEHEIQAQALADLLEEHGIPYLIDRFVDRAYDAMYLPQLGYGEIRVYHGDHELAEGLIRNFLAGLKRQHADRD